MWVDVDVDGCVGVDVDGCGWSGVQARGTYHVVGARDFSGAISTCVTRFGRSVNQREGGGVMCLCIV